MGKTWDIIMYKKIGKTKTIKSNKWWKYKKDNFILPNGNKGEYHYVETTARHSVICVPKYSKDKFLMILQYRYLFDDYYIEFPGGFIDPKLYDSFDYGENAVRELREETGFCASVIDELGEIMPYKGISNEISYVYLLQGLSWSPLPSEETEFMELLVFTPKQINKLIKMNKIIDSFTLSAWKMYEEMI